MLTPVDNSEERSAKATDLLDEQQVATVTSLLRASLGGEVFSLAEQYGLRVEDCVRYMSVASRLQEEREIAGLSIKDVAARLGLPQYRIRDAESSALNVQAYVLLRYADLVGLSEWYQEWSRQNPEFLERISRGQGGRKRAGSAGRASPHIVRFSGEIVSVKARIRLIRSFDQISHQYQGYLLQIAPDERSSPTLRVAIGPKAHEQFQFRIGDRVSGKGWRIPDPKQEWALKPDCGLRLKKDGEGSYGYQMD